MEREQREIKKAQISSRISFLSVLWNENLNLNIGVFYYIMTSETYTFKEVVFRREGW